MFHLFHLWGFVCATVKIVERIHLFHICSSHK